MLAINNLSQWNQIISIFKQEEGPRNHINNVHKFINILLIGIISVICGAETWKQMVGFAKSKRRIFLELPQRTASEDTINRLFSSIDNLQFEACFIEWVNSISDLSKWQIIAIESKIIREAKSHGKKSPIHMVSAWACESNLILGQIKTVEKSKEITAIPLLLDILDISEQTITIDAMGTQREIAEKIIDNNANYIMAVKANQAHLLENIEDNATIFQTSTRSHWAVENKSHWTLDVVFGEDSSRKRNKNAAQNYSVLLKIALNLLKMGQQKSKPLKGKG